MIFTSNTFRPIQRLVFVALKVYSNSAVTPKRTSWASALDYLPCSHSWSAFPALLVMASEPASKRPRLDDGEHADPGLVRVQRAAFLSSVSRNISPPPSTRATPDVEAAAASKKDALESNVSFSMSKGQHRAIQTGRRHIERNDQHLDMRKGSVNTSSRRNVVLPSPFTLTKIRDLPASSNVDTVSLHDILGNPLIKEAWVFNFCFDIDWMMQFFDPDVRDLVQVKIIHGSWRNEDSNKIAIDHACRRWKNVEAFKAYLPDQFGTHHSKMLVLFTHDDQAEVVIHTANMLQKDWTNLTQAVWRTGPLSKQTKMDGGVGPIGSGSRFKHDLLAYMKEYKKSAQALVKQLQDYDFGHVRGALIASVPSKFNNSLTSSTKEQHLWGFSQLREVLSHVSRIRIPSQRDDRDAQRHLVAQVSSIATLPNGWLRNLVESTHPPLLDTYQASIKQSPTTLSVIYPTAPNVASSLDGYAAGGSIHTKAQSATHLTQINNLRPHLCQWIKGPVDQFRAGRDKAAPHIKTYVQYNQTPTREALERGDVEIEWALLSSANLSVQAWGSLPKKGGGRKGANVAEEGTVHIQSFEIGVLVWPGLFAEGVAAKAGVVESGRTEANGDRKVKARIVPVFQSNTPDPDSDHKGRKEEGCGREDGIDEEADTVTIGLRLPYDLPLTPYAPEEMPWSPQGTYMAPDSKGRVWGGY